MANVLLFEGDAQARAFIERGLSEEGFTVSAVGDGESGLKLLGENEFDIVLLDMTVPTIGIATLRGIREAEPRLPIFALSNLDETGPMVVGLESGADEYITKPVSTRRLTALIRARLRRSEDEGSLSIGPLILDLAAHTVQVDGREVNLSSREVNLLAVLMRHRGEPLSRDELLKTVWKLDFDPGSNVVSVYVRSLRKKIGTDFIQTIPGQGYVLTASQDRAD
ncbi:MAG: response regulator transcription factor [Actinomycetota bacterium]|nr:response regulator transcription factor [Actinomycetota bacterium]